MHRSAQTHAEVAQWPKHQARDWKDVGLSPSRRISISRIKFLCWLKTRYKKIFIFLNEQYITGWITALNITQQQTQPSPKQSITSTSQHSHFTQLQPTEASPPPQRHPQTMCTVCGFRGGEKNLSNHKHRSDSSLQYNTQSPMFLERINIPHRGTCINQLRQRAGRQGQGYKDIYWPMTLKCYTGIYLGAVPFIQWFNKQTKHYN